MSILLWVLFGLAIGVIAKFLTPGRQPVGFLMTICLGMAGSLVGGFLGRFFGLYSNYQSTGGFMASILGAVLILAVWNILFAKKLFC